MSDEAGGGWVGWIRRRRGSRWEPVCEAPSIGECAKLLDQAARRRGIVSSVNQVMTRGGVYPRENRPAADDRGMMEWDTTVAR